MSITDKIIYDALKHPNDFAYYGENDDMFVTWGFFGPSVHRDSDNIDKSNYDYVLNEIEERFPNDYAVERFDHWAVGWIDQITIRVIGEDNKPTEIFNYMLDIKEQLENYPLLDEFDYSNRERDDAIDTIKFIAPAFEFKYKGDSYSVKENIPDDFAEQVFTWLADNYAYASSDEYSDEVIHEAFVELKFAVRI